MGFETVEIKVRGQKWSGLLSVEVDAGFDHAVRGFSIEMAANASVLQTFAPGTPIDIAFNNDLACRGYVDRLQPDFRRLKISGRSKGQDFVDCSGLDQNATGNLNQRIRPAECRKHEPHLSRIELQILRDRSGGDRQITAVQIRDDHGDEQHRKETVASGRRLRADVGCLH